MLKYVFLLSNVIFKEMYKYCQACSLFHFLSMLCKVDIFFSLSMFNFIKAKIHHPWLTISGTHCTISLGNNKWSTPR